MRAKHLFGQLKRIARQWLEGYLVCKGGTYPAQLKYKMLADMACEKITAGITRALIGQRPIKAMLDPYNPVGSTAHVRFNTSKTDRWETDARRCHINWIVLDSDWEAELCRVAESHPRVRAYVKNHNFGLEVPYRYGSEMRKYVPDFIALVDDGHGDDDLLHLIVEIKGYRREDAKVKKCVLRSQRAVEVNIAIMRTFVQLRRLMDSNRELACKIGAIEKKYDEQFAVVFDAIKRLIEHDKTRSVPPRRRIGY